MPPPPGLRARKRQSVRGTITTVAGQLFQQDGYDAVTMERVAQAADVARGTLYNHFPTKDHILAAWVHQELARDLGSLPLAGLASQEFAAGAAQLLGLSTRWCTAHRDLLPAYLRFCCLDMQSPEAAHGGDGLLALYARMIGNSQASGGIRADLPAPYLATMFHHLYLGALMRWLADPALSLDAEFSCALDVFLQGCAARSADKGSAS
ncbi:TetR/AcrR family transcriptional regulator [Bordetella bronchiseptica]|nr:TetR/AcrR family transcriptional regulator [Bordetella bronchiseptica]